LLIHHLASVVAGRKHFVAVADRKHFVAVVGRKHFVAVAVVGRKLIDRLSKRQR